MMNYLIDALTKSGLLKEDLDYRLIRVSMVIVFLLFGYQKWFEYEAQVLIPFISNGPLISWMYPAFGIRGASWFLGLTEWLFCLLLFWGFWNRKAGILGALGSCATFLATVSIIPFMPNGWDEVAGGFPAMTGNVPFLMKDVVLFAASFYLLKQDVVRATVSTERSGTTNYLIKNLAKNFLVVSSFRRARGCPVLGCVRVDDLRPFIRGILGQKIRNSRSPWLNHYISNDPHDHPVHSEWLGSGSGVSCDGWRGAVPDEGHCPPCCINLFAETGRGEGITFQQENQNGLDPLNIKRLREGHALNHGARPSELPFFQ